jgi:hypothetical protein
MCGSGTTIFGFFFDINFHSNHDDALPRMMIPKKQTAAAATAPTVIRMGAAFSML